MHATDVILSSVFLYSSLNTGARIQGTIAKKKKKDIKQLQTENKNEKD